MVHGVLQRLKLRERYRATPLWAKILVIACLVIVIIQFLYPANRVLLFARVGGDMVSLTESSQLADYLRTTYDGATVTTTVHETHATVKAGDVGIVPDTEVITHAATNYPWWLRLVPLSLVVKGALTNQSVVATVSGDAFHEYAVARQKECAIEPTNASVVVRGGELVLSPSANGATCSETNLQEQLTGIELHKGGETKLTITPTPVTPERTDAQVSSLIESARSVVSKPVVVTVAGKAYAPDAATIASWLSFPEDETTKKLSVGLDAEKVTAYLLTLQKDIYVTPGVTVITTVDSIETGRVSGANGRGIDTGATAEKISQALLGDGSLAVEANLSVLAPTVQYSRSYSNTPAGLQSLVNDLAQGKNIAISVRKLGDTGVSANGDTQYHPASTYKLFVAYSVLKRIDAGGMSWGGGATGGQTVAQCFETMIVNSDNACAEWFGKTISWNAVQADARGIGASRTSFGVDFKSTANDLALFLQKLESNQLGISEDSRARLLDAMKRQRYRQGVPAGVGVTVADKVGFLDGKLHDAAIVYAPSGVYVVVILTDNSSWAEIASIANQIHTQIQR